MGRMHVQRAIESAEPPGTIVCTDISDERLDDLCTSFSMEAKSKGIDFICLNPLNKEEYAERMAAFKEAGFDDILIMAPVPPVIADASTYIGKGKVNEIAEAGCLWLLFTGGEVFARPDFMDIYGYAKAVKLDPVDIGADEFGSPVESGILIRSVGIATSNLNTDSRTATIAGSTATPSSRSSCAAPALILSMRKPPVSSPCCPRPWSRPWSPAATMAATSPRRRPATAPCIRAPTAPARSAPTCASPGAQSASAASIVVLAPPSTEPSALNVIGSVDEEIRTPGGMSYLRILPLRSLYSK